MLQLSVAFGLLLSITPFSCDSHYPWKKGHSGKRGNAGDGDTPNHCEPPDPPEPAASCPWQPFGDSIGSGNVQMVAFDPTTAGRVYVSAASTLYASEDGGVTFETLGSLGARCNTLGFTSKPGVFLAGTNDGVARTEDGGATWKPQSLGGLVVPELITHPAAEQQVYATVDGVGVLSSNDGGLHWLAVNSGMPRSAVPALLPLSSSPEHVLAGFAYLNGLATSLQGGVLRTDSGGAEWTQTFEGARVRELDQCDADASIIWAVQNPGGLARSEDGGSSFEFVPLPQHVEEVAVRGEDCQRVYAAVRHRGFFRSMDGGATWEGPLNDGISLKNYSPLAMAVSDDGSDTIIVGAGGGAYRSDDRGATWSRIVGIGAPHVSGFAAQHAGGPPVWMQTWGAGLWRRDGASWSPVADHPSDFGQTIAISPHDPEHIIAGDFHSFDGGASWVRPTGVANTTSVTFHPVHADIVYLTSQVAGFLRSYDGGQTFEVANGELEPWATDAGTFVDARGTVLQDDRIYMGTRGRGVFASDDDGDHWTMVSPELERAQITRLVSNGVQMLAVVALRGPHIFADAKWSLHADGLRALDVSDALWNELDGRWYVSTSSGVYRSDGTGEWTLVEPTCQHSTERMALVRGSGGAKLITAGNRGVLEVLLE